MKKTFNDAFFRVNLSENIRAAFEPTYIESLKANKENQSLSVCLSSDTEIEPHIITELEGVLLIELGSFSQVRVSVTVLTKDDATPKDSLNLDKLFTDNWSYIAKEIADDQPSLSFFLGGAEVDCTDGIVNIGLRGKGSFFVREKGLGRIIAGIMQRRFAIMYTVDFYDLDLPLMEVADDVDSACESVSPTISVSSDNIETNIGIPECSSIEQSSTDTLQRTISTQPPPRPKPSQKQSSAKPVYLNSGKRRKKGIKLLDEAHIIDTKLNEELFNQDTIIIGGEIFESSARETKTGNLVVSFDITDGTGSITCKFFIDKDIFAKDFEPVLKAGQRATVKGTVTYDDFIKETVIMVTELAKMEGAKASTRFDNTHEKRVELHLHTRMSDMDATSSASDYIKRAASWGHKAIAITDHGVVQAYPESYDAAKKHGIKVIYGVEAYLIDDMGAICKYVKGQDTSSDFVVFDIETTGLNKDTDSIIEIAAVKVREGVIVDEFCELINPSVNLSQKIISLTGITDDMLRGKPKIDSVLNKFLDFARESVLAAHSVSFDAGFIATWAKRLYGKQLKNTLLDTVELSRALYPELKSHKLNLVAAHLGIELKSHHRALDDAKACAEILLESFKRLQGLSDKPLTLDEINAQESGRVDKAKLQSNHAVILAKNQEGLRNLYELISKSHIDYFRRRPRIPKSEYMKHSSGLMIGTACEAGELYQAVLNNAPISHVESLASFYDYFEIQPIDNNVFLLREERVRSREELMEINKRIVALGQEFNKPVVATCDVHFLDPEDEVYRRIIMAGNGFDDADLQAPLYFRTTEEMLTEFEYLGESIAHEVVVANTNLIANMCEEIKPIPDGTFPPVIEGSDEALRTMCEERACALYGDELPKFVSERLNRELDSIISNGFAVMYVIAQKLVSKSEADGYLVGSRGSVGSSFAATMSGITEVNPLPPHYVCYSCRFTDFDSELVENYKKTKPGNSGCDMDDRDCPNCGVALHKDGHDIPFETFLGFDGDKEPDIDLNFSGEYQSRAHDYAEELFGKEYIFKAGTISTVADKTAFGYVKNYMDERGRSERNAEINRIKKGITGVKKTTGQHPGGLMVVPESKQIYDFCPIQRPANDMKSSVVTTHFDYNAISGRLLKLDLLGHDVPTIIRYLHDNTGVNPQTVDPSDKDVVSLFSSCEPLGITASEIGCKTGTLGLPEFGTTFVRQMLTDTQPTSFSDLVRISGLSHGTDVWLNNAQLLIKDGTCTLEKVISTRDDIMVYLISKGLPRLKSFQITEDVRKGKGLKDEYEELMREFDVPEWYIESCNRIKYMFPKGHAVAYVLMTMRIGYFKLHHPLSFYGASFSVKYDDFDYEIMCKGAEPAKRELSRLRGIGNDIAAKEKSTLNMLELVCEMYARGLNFVPLCLYEAHATKFLVTDDGLMPPLCAVAGLGETVAQNIVEAREEGEFFTVDDFRERTKATKTVIELLKKTAVLEGLPETNQMTLF